MTRINIGCGMTPTRGWLNYDNSPSLALATLPPLVTRAMARAHIISAGNLNYIEFCRTHEIRKANANGRIPHPENSVSVVYASHMLEHLDRREAKEFLNESFRILIPGGIIRLAVPNIRYHLDQYLKDGDADRFLGGLRVCRLKPTSFLARIKDVVLGARHHHWMYDDASLVLLLTNAGYVGAMAMPSGETTIPEPGQLNLSERAPESLFVEARKPA